ncbi:unnamed protein product (macronuclear) [Paramecium tetraurelia]|uniref:Uncharacterized protein n=1 Tax=Paramecium tetraurelia TaxID=5888 RepID=A0CPK2_PARTE|nr:uncharacterized protein GSPATT00009111001 [Paramecium tetraurelia]CAK72719.1 unnamed protein product [Paramecium tetraurelia]|eukprot:XP_001440116.1 hypothetical protein (macronuclear) [Paramecium tetraurelia strain d4-2]
MFKARKLGPQSYLDYLRDEMPTESTTITKKDQTYWNNKNQFFSKIAFTQQNPNESRNIGKIENFKNESQLRLKRNEYKRTILEIKSRQKQSQTSKYVVSDEDLNLPLFQRPPAYLDNQTDNYWNHLELLDKKHLKQVYGPKTFQRQRQAINQIDKNFQADIELQQMKLQAQFDFRNRLLNHRSLQASKGNVKALELSYLRQVRPEYKGLVLLNMTTIEQQYLCPTLYQHVEKYDISASMQTKKKQQQQKNARSRSLNTQQSEIDESSCNQKEYEEMKETIQKFEIKLKEKCQFLQR